jgi:predicted nuclease of predicted toxin-antitoxin system
MRFLLDANMPYSAKNLFLDPHSASHVRDIGLQDATDEDIIFWARKHKAVLVTRDFDFANILNFPPGENNGIIVLKIPNFYTASDIKRVLENFLKKVEFSSIPKSTIIVEETRFRIKR